MLGFCERIFSNFDLFFKGYWNNGLGVVFVIMFLIKVYMKIVIVLFLLWIYKFVLMYIYGLVNDNYFVLFKFLKYIIKVNF